MSPQLASAWFIDRCRAGLARASSSPSRPLRPGSKRLEETAKAEQVVDEGWRSRRGSVRRIRASAPPRAPGCGSASRFRRSAGSGSGRRSRPMRPTWWRPRPFVPWAVAKVNGASSRHSSAEGGTSGPRPAARKGPGEVEQRCHQPRWRRRCPQAGARQRCPGRPRARRRSSHGRRAASPTDGLGRGRGGHLSVRRWPSQRRSPCRRTATSPAAAMPGGRKAISTIKGDRQRRAELPVGPGEDRASLVVNRPLRAPRRSDGTRPRQSGARTIRPAPPTPRGSVSRNARR